MINNNIKESYCSFELSLLLKEKGFEVVTFGTFTEIVPSFPDKITQVWHRNLVPTHALAIAWIRINFGILISADGDCYGNEWYSKLSVVSEDLWGNLDRRHEVVSATKKFNSIHKTVDEAIEAAIDYTLKNLI